MVKTYLYIKNMKAADMIQQKARPFSVESNTLYLVKKFTIDILKGQKYLC